MPVPMINVLNGGAHADNPLDFQEFMVLPVGATSFAEAVRMGAEVFHALKDALKRAGHSVNVGDEGGFAPDLRAAEEALDFLMAAIGQAGLRPGQDVALGLDPAASEFHRPAGYVYAGQDRRLSAEEQVDYLAALTRAYPILSIEDGMAEDDPAGWKMLTERLGASCQLVGDDVFCTNPRLFEQGIGQGLANAILVKPNQIGTLTEMQQVLRLAARNGYRVVMSHRSGETEDTSIADLAVAGHCGGIKTGSMSRSDRTAKYNRLLRIERELGAAAVYASALPPGRDCRRHLRAKIFSVTGDADARTCQCRKTMGRAGRDGPVRLPGIDRVLRPGILWPGIWPGRRHHDHLHGQRSARGCPGFGRRRAARQPAGRRVAAMLHRRLRAAGRDHSAGAVPVQLAGARHPPCRAGACRGSLSLQRPGAIAAAVARASCRLTPVTRTRRIPALTGAGMLPLMRRAYCPAAGVLCRRSHSDSCLGTGPDVCSISGRTPSHVWRNAVHSRSRRIPMFRKSLIAALVLAAAPQLLWAHAHVGTATPAKDAVLAKTPATVTLTLTEGLEAAFSSLTLQDAAGKTVPTEKSALAPGDNKTLVLPIGKDLPAGVYTVKWQALSKDGHKTNGAWSFTIKP